MTAEPTDRDALILENMRLVSFIAKRYRWIDVEWADLVQEGTIGLIRAADTYDPSRGIAFSTYAGRCVKRRLMKIAGKTGRQVVVAFSLDEPIKPGAKGDGESRDVHEVIADPDSALELQRAELHEVLHGAMAYLTPREQEIITKKYFTDGKQRADRDIATELGCSHQYTQEIVARARMKMRSYLKTIDAKTGRKKGGNFGYAMDTRNAPLCQPDL